MIEPSLLAMRLRGYRKAEFHTHSSFSDGEDSIEDLVKAAIDLGLEAIAITDHVRRETDWLDDYAKEIEKIKSTYGKKIDVYSGIEAKVIDPEGDIDARAEFWDKVDIILGAIHRIPKEKDEYMKTEEVRGDKETALRLWLNATNALIRNPKVTVLAHPCAYLKKADMTLPKEMKARLAKEAAKNQKIIEKNLKYDTPDKEFLKLLEENKVQTITGSDSHSADELRGFWR
jgi:putative hydrolase